MIEWSKYFNLPEVRITLHIPSYVPPFQFSNDEVFAKYQFAIEGSAFINEVLHMHGYKMLHLFGDTDGACSVLGTRKWIKRTGWKNT